MIAAFAMPAPGAPPRSWIPLCASLLALASAATAAETVWVGRFDAADGAIPAPWRIKRIDERIAPTRYRLREWDGVAAVEAHAVKSMALLARPLEVDLARTPVLCWRWRVDAPVAAADMTRKSGDDYAARVYLTFDVPPERLGLAERAGLGLARSLHGEPVPDAAVNYVWDNRQPVGTLRENAYTGRARMLVLRSGPSQAGAWVAERRDAAADFRRAFGHPPGRLTGLAIASDTDDTGEEARAGFADFVFVGAATACPAS